LPNNKFEFLQNQNKDDTVNRKVTSPLTQETLVELPFHTDTEIDQKLNEAQTAFQTWHKLSLEERTRSVRA